MSKGPAALYLHGGPGLNCVVERAWFGNSGGVLWWDQPRFAADAGNAYQATLDAAADILAKLHARQGGPIHVIGWSFGARLALDLLHRAPEAISTLTLLAPTLCLETAFARIAAYLAANKTDVPAPHFSFTGNHEDFMQRVMSILSIPDLFSHYWAPASKALFHRHCAEITSADWFDLDTFTAVSREVIKRPLAALSPKQANRIRIFAGRHDPYFGPEADIDLWKKLFPQASIRIVDSGHMLPLEIPAAEWLVSPFQATSEINSAP